jgi:RNA polymerase sigma-70 factor (ECF subfamily)
VNEWDTATWDAAAPAEAALIARCTSGDQQACAELVRAHQRMVFNLSYHLLGNQDDARDLSQEVFLRVFRTLGSFRGESALRTWIYRIVVNQARNRQRVWMRRHRRDQISLDQHVEETGDLPCENRLPDGVLASKELAAKLWQALDHLPFDQRTAMVLREIDGLRYEEIAFSLGIAVGTVKSRLTRARQALRAELVGVRS